MGYFPITIMKHHGQGDCRRKNLFGLIVPEGYSPWWYHKDIAAREATESSHLESQIGIRKKAH